MIDKIYDFGPFENSSRDFPNGYIGKPLGFSYYIFKIEMKRRKRI
jgi:hypothetical protein